MFTETYKHHDGQGKFIFLSFCWEGHFEEVWWKLNKISCLVLTSFLWFDTRHFIDLFFILINPNARMRFCKGNPSCNFVQVWQVGWPWPSFKDTLTLYNPTKQCVTKASMWRPTSYIYYQYKKLCQLILTQFQLSKHKYW